MLDAFFQFETRRDATVKNEGCHTWKAKKQVKRDKGAKQKPVQPYDGQSLAQCRPQLALDDRGVTRGSRSKKALEKGTETTQQLERHNNTEEEDDSGSCQSSCRSAENVMSGISENDADVDVGEEEVSCASYASYDDESLVCDDMGVLGTSSAPFELKRKARASERSVYAGPELWYEDDDDDEWD